MGEENILAIMGSPGSGKTVMAVKLARTLAAKKKNVIVVFCDPFTPPIPALVSHKTVHDVSLGTLLTAPGLEQEGILKACVPAVGSEHLGLLGYRSGESLMNYPKVTHDKAMELFVSLRYLAEYVIIDCATVFEADPASLVAIEAADRVLGVGTANLKGISWFQTHLPMLADRRYCREKHRWAIGNLKEGQDWEAVSCQYGGVEYVLPYTTELEQQGNELNLFEPLFSAEGGSYQAQINRILFDIFEFQATQACAIGEKRSKGKRQGTEKSPKVVNDHSIMQSEVVKPQQERKKRQGFKMSFRNRGEF